LVHYCRLDSRTDRTRRYACVQHLGFILTTLLGIGGSIVGGLIGRLFSKPEPGAAFHPAGFVLSIIGAIILLFIWGKLSPA
jgi:uncharacterized membrane protein YeaQ/YmgE (transglycosylase-associated protein family)